MSTETKHTPRPSAELVRSADIVLAMIDNGWIPPDPFPDGWTLERAWDEACNAYRTSRAVAELRFDLNEERIRDRVTERDLLVAACKRAVAYMTHDSSEKFGERKAVVDDLRAAIAKATGSGVSK